MSSCCNLNLIFFNSFFNIKSNLTNDGCWAIVCIIIIIIIIIIISFSIDAMVVRLVCDSDTMVVGKLLFCFNFCSL